MAPIPHTIRFADDSSDKLTVSQKQRIVNRKNAKYASGDTDTTTSMAAAFANAKSFKSTQETNNITNRSLLANAMESLAKNEVEEKYLSDYKASRITIPIINIASPAIQYNTRRRFPLFV